MSISEIKKKVLERIRPLESEVRAISSFSEYLRSLTKEFGYESVTVGSIGKHTWLRGDHDVDLFILFPKGTTREDLEEKGLHIGKQIAEKLKSKTKIKYAEHPYTQILYEKYKIDIVPCYRIDVGEKIISAVDRSPLHLAYVLEKLKPGLRDEVRLLKQFCKGVGVYGSDARTQGFSGYICELLVLQYGSFEKVLQAAASWKWDQLIDVEEAKKQDSIFNAPLVIIDPTDGSRNAAAAINTENFARFISSAKQFLKRPIESEFWMKEEKLAPLQVKELKSRETKFIALIMNKPDVIDDILFPQLRKGKGRIIKMLQHEEFELIRSLEFGDDELQKMFLIFELEAWELPKMTHMEGPPVYAHKNAKQFLSKYAKAPFGPFVIEENWVIDKERNFTKATDLLKDLIKKKQAELIEIGIPDNIAKSFAKARLIEDEEFWELVNDSKSLSDFMRRRYFEKLVI